MTSLSVPALQCEDRIKDLEKTLVQPASASNHNERTWLNDPDNAHNWPLSIKIYHTIIPSAFGFLVYVHVLFVRSQEHQRS